MARKQNGTRFGNWQNNDHNIPTKPATTARPPVLVRYIDDGVPLDLAVNSSFSEVLTYAGASDKRMTLTVLSRADTEQIAELATAWALHPLLVEDLLHAGQRPKIERYGDVLFLVVRSARYIDELEEVEFSEFHLVVKQQALAIVCQDGRLIDGTTIESLTGEHENVTESPLGTGGFRFSTTTSCSASAPKPWFTACWTPSSTDISPPLTDSRSTKSKSNARYSAEIPQPPNASTA